MGWESRDYTWFPERGSRLETLRAMLPPRGALVLSILHISVYLAALLVAGIRGQESFERLFVLSADPPRPAALFLHPFGFNSLLTLLAVLSAVASLGGRIETLLGARSMFVQYVLGCLFGGLAFVAIGSISPAQATWALAVPVGGIAAWTATMWTRLPFEVVMLFERPLRIAHLAAAAIGLAVVAGLFAHGVGATAWICAGIVGATIPPFLAVLLELMPLGGRRPVAAKRVDRRARVHAAASLIPLDDRLPEAEESEIEKSAEPDLDAILAKISRSGLNSLTEQERQDLEAARQARLRNEKAKVQ